MKFAEDRLCLRSYLSDGQHFFINRTDFTRRTQPNWHTHDFAEFFWITRGQCRHCHEEGDEVLSEGDVRFVRPEHGHEFHQYRQTRAQLINVALPSTFLEAWEQEYPVLRGHFFWTSSKKPSGFRLTEGLSAQWLRRAEYWAMHADSLLILHHGMMRLFLDLLPELTQESELPFWLSQGLNRLRTPEVFSAGSGGLARACGRSVEHVARTTKQLLGKTPSELVNEVRMDFAARQLRMTDSNILDIMLDCGLSNPSHFYALFRQHHGETPRQYRVRRSRVVG